MPRRSAVVNGRRKKPPRKNGTPTAAVVGAIVSDNLRHATTALRELAGRREPTHREIERRAYFIYLQRGGAPGDPVADWLQAERELRAELNRAAPRRF